MLGLMALAPLFRRVCLEAVESDPEMLAKHMKMSQSTEVREYGYMLELALLRERERKRRKVVVSQNATTTPGNAAAMRQALMEIVITATKAGATMGYDVACGIIKSKAKHALSAPPRNCDIYDSESCRMAYHQHGDGIMTMQAFADWLLAAATERGGQNKGGAQV